MKVGIWYMEYGNQITQREEGYGTKLRSIGRRDISYNLNAKCVIHNSKMNE